MTALWHYTCDHGRRGIGDEGRLLSGAVQIDPAKLAKMPAWARTISEMIWLTDLDAPLRDALSLTSNSIRCDRTQFRYRVTNYKAMHYPAIRRDLPKRTRDELERAPGALPMHWWVAYTPVPVVYDPILQEVQS